MTRSSCCTLLSLLLLAAACGPAEGTTSTSTSSGGGQSTGSGGSATASATGTSSSGSSVGTASASGSSTGEVCGLFGCSGNTSTGGSSTGGCGPFGCGNNGTSTGGGFATAAHAMPAVPFNGGPIIASPTLVTITYPDDAYRSGEEGFGNYMVTSNWLTTVGKEYGIGAGQNVNVELTQNSPQTIADTPDIQNLIGSMITAGTVPGLNNSLQTHIYMIYFPQTTSITVENQDLCTISGGGYHSYGTVNGENFVYAVVSNCLGGLPANPPDNIYWASSHELFEACSDPFPSLTPGYSFENSSPLSPWYLIGGELADMCAEILPQWSENGYNAIQRIWSNNAALDGGSPCLPNPETYFGVSATPLNFVTVAAGQSTTFDLVGWSTAAVSPFEVQIGGITGTFSAQANLSTTLNNGQTTTLSVAVPFGTPSNNYAAVQIVSGNSATDFTTTEVGVVVQ